MTKHKRTKLHKEMLRGGLEYERCPRCEENIKRSEQSRMSYHLKRCRVKRMDFYKGRGQFYVCTELMELLARDIPEAEVMEARKEREALLDKFPSEDQSDAEEVLEPSVADLSRKEMLAKMEEMMALDTTQSSEEVMAQVDEWKRDVLEQAQVSRKKQSSDASEGQGSFTVYVTFASDEVVREDSARLRYLFAVEMVFELRKKYPDGCRL